jgi:hypothetical protein
MVQNFMDVLKKQTNLAPNGKSYVPAPDVLPAGPIRVLVLEEGYINDEMQPVNRKIVIQSKQFARTKLAKPRTVVVDDKEYVTNYQEHWMAYLEDLTPKKADAQGGAGTPGQGGSGHPAGKQL